MTPRAVAYVTTGGWEVCRTYRCWLASSEEISNQQGYLKLKARYESLQWIHRNLMGEDLGPFNNKELESLERQLDMSLKQIQSIRQLVGPNCFAFQRVSHA